MSGAGCSFLYDLNTTQCEVDSDCPALGTQFANTVCRNRVCVKDTAGTGGTSSTNGGSAGSSKGGATVTSGGMDTLGGSSQGGALNAGGSAGTGIGAEAGAGGQPECVTNGDCIDLHVDQPYVCKSGACQALTNDDCPVLIPTNKTLELLRKSDPIVLGAFASMTNAQDPHDTQAIINWDLAFDELNSSTLGGLPSSNGGDLRPVLGLVCQGKTTDVSASMTHLTHDVEVPAVLTTLSADNLYAAFNFTRSTEYTTGGGQPVFFMSTGSADLRLANMKDDGLVWHMLGDPRVLAATTVALLKRIEPVVNAKRKEAFMANSAMEDPDSVPLRVTLVYSDDPTMTDIATVLTTDDTAHPETLLWFNGQAAIDPGNAANFRQVQIQSAKYHTPANVANGLTELETNPPHVILAIATSEFPQSVVPPLETYWDNPANSTKNQPRPYYLMSHFIYNTSQLQTVAAQYATRTPPLNARIVGVNYAQAQDDHSKRLYTSYLGRLQNSYAGTLPLDGTENYYDGAYSLLYAVAAAAAARTTPTGNNVRDGLEDRIFSTSTDAVTVDVGPSPIGGAVGSLNSNFAYKMSLWGNMGPPNFDRGSGTRLSASSAWCIQKNAANSAWEYQADGLLYDPKTKTFSYPTTGVPTCLQGF